MRKLTPVKSAAMGAIRMAGQRLHSCVGRSLGAGSQPLSHGSSSSSTRGVAQATPTAGNVSTVVQPGTVMTVVRPFAPRSSLPEALQALPAVPALLDAIKACEHRPFRVISHETDGGRVFNCAFFDNVDAFVSYREWFAEHALRPGGEFYADIAQTFADRGSMPTAESWLWGTGTRILSDTRFGEYQLGMAVRYSQATFIDAAAAEDAGQRALDPAFERKIARGMQDAGVAYFGRIVMQEEASGRWITASRYGSLEDAQRGTAAVKRIAADDISRWFSTYEYIIGTARRILEL